MVPVHILMMKIKHMLLSWFSAALEGPKEKLEDSISIVQQSLEFLVSRAEEIGRVPSSEEVLDQDAG